MTGARLDFNIDAHVHLWDEAHTPQPWMTADTAEIARPFGPADLKPLLDRNGVDAVVVVQGAALDSDTDYLLLEAERQPWIAGLTAWLDLERPLRASTRLEQLLEHPKLRGIRPLSHLEPDPHWLLREPVLESIGLVEQAGLILEVPVVYPDHFDDVVDLAERFPRLALVVDHLGKPPLEARDLDDWESKLRACAEAPNVVAKLSGLNTTFARSDWSADDMFSAAAVAVDAFGVERLMCGSDWPVALLNGDYDRVWEATRRVASEVAPGRERALLGGTAARVYRLTGNDQGGTS